MMTNKEHARLARYKRARDDAKKELEIKQVSRDNTNKRKNEHIHTIMTKGGNIKALDMSSKHRVDNYGYKTYKVLSEPNTPLKGVEIGNTVYALYDGSKDRLSMISKKDVDKIIMYVSNKRTEYKNKLKLELELSNLTETEEVEKVIEEDYI